MAKYEFKVYDDNDKVKKVHQRNTLPVGLYIKFNEFKERVDKNEVTEDLKLFLELKDLFLEFFPTLTEDDYLNHADVSEVLVTFATILAKAMKIEANQKNA